ncbi:Cloroperoxidase [Mycena rebaudengoi]|nr:Cloroperoxidase [Mycena rebaudengoi]
MKLLTFSLIIAAVALSGTAFPSDASNNDHKWIAPKATDVRSPCPGLNTLANHGYLPRSGKKISIPMILDAADKGFNMAADAVLVAAKFGLLSGNDPTTLDLDALKLHNLIEHDASLSRNDVALGDNLRFNETIFSTLAKSNPGVDFYNATSAGHVQHDRLAISLATNPNITNTPKETLVRSRESAFYLSVMGDPLTGIAPKKFVQIFFREERLPIAEGWKRPTTRISVETLNPIESLVQEVSDWTFTQRCEDLVLGPDLII